jgi:hypothetical protein
MNDATTDRTVRRRLGYAAAVVVVIVTCGVAWPADQLRPPPTEVTNEPRTVIKEKDNFTLNIAARRWAPGSPREGWCGETAIQEVMLYYGAYFPQSIIHAAGHPRHPDLQDRDLPVALRALGAEFQQWPKVMRQRPDMSVFLDWVRERVARGVPVLIGVKIYPTEHEDWFLDHFVLVVGVTGKSLIVNTTYGNRRTLTEDQLRSTNKWYALANPFNRYYGIAITGTDEAADGNCPVRLFVNHESDRELAVTFKCEGLRPGAVYRVYRMASRQVAEGEPILSFHARSASQSFSDVIRHSDPAIYRCKRTPDNGSPLR